MTFNDIFKSGFLESVSGFSVTDTLLGLVFSLVIGLFIFLIYRKTCAGIMYSSNFALTLIGLTLVTTLVIMAVTSNVILSLGMVGALSIVRFRAAIKEPVEIVYLFWSIAAGIVVGAGLIPLSLIGSAIIGLVLYIMASRKTHESPYMLVLRLSDEYGEQNAMKIVGENAAKTVVKAKTVSKSGIELSVEVRLKDPSTSFINRLCKIDGVTDATLVSYSGEYMS
ncbi:MAG: DUF4956 domain-containing protein [Firmicutes bacterium]|nr:DUF4956 domain-containing protein [Bacillota bacterium]